ncbi:MAG: hypothetical protein D3908_16745, partial [Candidatus Electrothrix sp. AUS4]|nr:hypothetical protein [Candidatus Electrothrix sp. AUS4]
MVIDHSGEESILRRDFFNKNFLSISKLFRNIKKSPKNTTNTPAMLIIPVSKNFKKSFPYVTLTLIIVNALIFFGFQLDENTKYAEAISFYQSADLLTIEAPLYRKYLAQQNEPFPEGMQAKELFWTMFQDNAFQQELQQRRLLPPDAPAFGDWLSKRETF